MKRGASGGCLGMRSPHLTPCGIVEVHGETEGLEMFLWASVIARDQVLQNLTECRL
jgi:hypothetical protein